MYVAEKIREPAQINAVALKAYARVADAWGLSLKEGLKVSTPQVSSSQRGNESRLSSSRVSAPAAIARLDSARARSRARHDAGGVIVCTGMQWPTQISPLP